MAAKSRESDSISTQGPVTDDLPPPVVASPVTPAPSADQSDDGDAIAQQVADQVAEHIQAMEAEIERRVAELVAQKVAEAAPPVTVQSPTEALQEQQRRAAQEELASGGYEKRTEGVRGGRYLVGGQWVDANGQPIAEE